MTHAFHIARLCLLLNCAAACSQSNEGPVDRRFNLEPEQFLVKVTMVRAFESTYPFYLEIDGVRANMRTYVFDRTADVARSIDLRLYHAESGALVAQSQTTSNCLASSLFAASVVEEELVVAVYPNGHLVLGGSNCITENGNLGNTDNQVQDCQNGLESQCGPQERCALRRVHESPEIMQLGCASGGTLALGQVCVFDTPGPMNFDQCEAGSGCIDGFCRLLCYTFRADSCATVSGTQCSAIDDLKHAMLGACN